MTRALLISTVAALTLAAGTGAALAFGNGHKGGHHGPRGPMFQFEEVDANGDGKITQDEITAFSKARFDAADTDQDGVLRAEEMAAQMQARMAKRMTKRAKHMIVELDANDDGMLSYEEMLAARQGHMMGWMDADLDGGVSAEDFARMQSHMGWRGDGDRDGGHHGRHGGQGHGGGYGGGHGGGYGHGEGSMGHNGRYQADCDRGMHQ
jgi:hypothetical protein